MAYLSCLNHEQASDILIKVLLPLLLAISIGCRAPGYRVRFTINGRYIGIGTKYFHDYFEQNHWDPANPSG